MDHLALAGHAGAFPMTPAAKTRILSYLGRARTDGQDDPDRDDVLRDIEADLGDHLRAALDSGAELDDDTIARILEQFGPVESPRSVPQRRAPVLCRIDEGRMLSGLCLGLATRAELRVDWLRTIAFFLLLLTGGLLGLAYLIALLFAPRIASAQEYRALLVEQSNAEKDGPRRASR